MSIAFYDISSQKIGSYSITTSSLDRSTLSPREFFLVSHTTNEGALFWESIKSSLDRIANVVLSVARTFSTNQLSLTWCGIPELLYAISLSESGRYVLKALLPHIKSMNGPFNFSDVGADICMPSGSSRVREIADIPQFLESLSFAGAIIWISNILRRSSRETIISDDGLLSLNRSVGDELTFLTYNVCGLPSPIGPLSLDENRFVQIGQTISKFGVSIVCLQEMWDSHTEALISSSGYSHRAGVIKTGSVLGRSGLVTLSQFPIIYSEVLPFSTTGGLEKLVAKGALFTRIRTPVGEIDVYNVHFASEPERLNRLFVSRSSADKIRLAQIDELTSWIRRRKEAGIPVFLLGDFNIDESDVLYKDLILCGGIDVFRSRIGTEITNERGCSVKGATFDPTCNRYARSPRGIPERIDYIFADSTSLDSYAFGSKRIFVESPLSDHYGVCASVKFLEG